jgi:hypothetical protein
MPGRVCAGQTCGRLGSGPSSRCQCRCWSSSRPGRRCGDEEHVVEVAPGARGGPAAAGPDAGWWLAAALCHLAWISRSEVGGDFFSFAPVMVLRRKPWCARSRKGLQVTICVKAISPRCGPTFSIMVVKVRSTAHPVLVAGALRERGLASAEARRWCARFRAVAGCAPCSPGSR